MKMNHLGGGVCLFPSAIDCDWDVVISEFSNAVNFDFNEMYQDSFDPETGEGVLVNKSGYLFPKTKFDEMPKRGSTIHQRANEQMREILDLFENSKDECLLDYMLMFPLAYKNIWWKVKGHIVCYDSKNKQYLGSHSDTSADYLYGYEHPRDQLATRNTVSCIVYVNSHESNSSSVDKNCFSGGAHKFDFLDIEYLPRRGDILMFPSNFIASHQVLPVTDGIRFSYLGWYSHGSPNQNFNEQIVDPIKEPETAKIATNVYMPNLRENFMNHIIKNDANKHQYALSLVNGGNT